MGNYSRDDVADIQPILLEIYFMKIDGSFRIVKSIRDNCIFATQNALKDPPFIPDRPHQLLQDLIYLEPILQKKLMASFPYSLNNSGYLVLGKAETVSAAQSLWPGR